MKLFSLFVCILTWISSSAFAAHDPEFPLGGKGKEYVMTFQKDLVITPQKATYGAYNYIGFANGRLYTESDPDANQLVEYCTFAVMYDQNERFKALDTVDRLLHEIVLKAGTTVRLSGTHIFATGTLGVDKDWKVTSVDFELNRAFDPNLEMKTGQGVRFERTDAAPTKTLLTRISCFGEDLRVKDLEHALPVTVEVVDRQR